VQNINMRTVDCGEKSTVEMDIELGG